MEVKSILLCESAVSHADNTFSVLRGGLDTWVVQDFPAQVIISFVFTLKLLSTEVDKEHRAELDLIDMDGNRIVPQWSIPFSILLQQDVITYKWNLVVGNAVVGIPKAGRYSLQIGVDGHNLSSTGFQVVQPPRQG
jgi:hypothetical protein